MRRFAEDFVRNRLYEATLSGTKLKFYDVIKCPNIFLDNFKTKSSYLNLCTFILRYLIASLNCVSLVLVLILIGDHEILKPKKIKTDKNQILRVLEFLP